MTSNVWFTNAPSDYVNTTSNTWSTGTNATWTWNWRRCPRWGLRKGRKSVSKSLYRLDDGDYFVRGTTDLEEVKRLLEGDEYLSDSAPLDEDWEVVLDSPMLGLWRFVPCSPRGCGEHSWHLVHTKKRGRGVMEGVYTQASVRGVAFGIDVLVPDDVP